MGPYNKLTSKETVGTTDGAFAQPFKTQLYLQMSYERIDHEGCVCMCVCVCECECVCVGTHEDPIFVFLIDI